MFLTIFVLLLFSISHCNADACYCTCCASNLCTPTLQGTITVASCASSYCDSVCQNAYPTQCTSGSGFAIYQCISGQAPTPNWIGVFNMENRCDIKTCCCPIGQMILTREVSNQLRIQMVFSGAGCGETTSLDQMISMPTGYTVQITFLSSPIQVVLSEDSGRIIMINPVLTSCIEIATRSGSASLSTVNLASVFLLCSLMAFTQFIL